MPSTSAVSTPTARPQAASRGRRGSRSPVSSMIVRGQATVASRAADDQHAVGHHRRDQSGAHPVPGAGADAERQVDRAVAAGTQQRGVLQQQPGGDRAGREQHGEAEPRQPATQGQHSAGGDGRGQRQRRHERPDVARPAEVDAAGAGQRERRRDHQQDRGEQGHPAGDPGQRRHRADDQPGPGRGRHRPAALPGGLAGRTGLPGRTLGRGLGRGLGRCLGRGLGRCLGRGLGRGLGRRLARRRRGPGARTGLAGRLPGRAHGRRR